MGRRKTGFLRVNLSKAQNHPLQAKKPKTGTSQGQILLKHYHNSWGDIRRTCFMGKSRTVQACRTDNRAISPCQLVSP